MKKKIVKKLKAYKPRLKTPAPIIVPDKTKDKDKYLCRKNKGRIKINEDI